MAGYGTDGWTGENAEEVKDLMQCEKYAEKNQRKKVIILGCGGHAKSVFDTLLSLSNEYEIAGFVGGIRDKGFVYEGIGVIGTDDDLEKIYASGVHHAVLGIGFLGHGNLRNNLVAKLQKAGFFLPSIIDSTAVVSKSANIGEGTFVGKGAVINADAHIGKYCIINSCCLVEHDCQVGDFTHIAVSACVCGGVTVGRECLVGANATIIQGLKVADNSIVPAGETIFCDIKVGGRN